LVEMDTSIQRKIDMFVRLLDEGTEVYRPTQALDLGDGLFRLEATVDYDSETEVWEFAPGSVVRSEIRSTESGQYLIAVRF